MSPKAWSNCKSHLPNYLTWLRTLLVLLYLLPISFHKMNKFSWSDYYVTICDKIVKMNLILQAKYFVMIWNRVQKYYIAKKNLQNFYIPDRRGKTHVISKRLEGLLGLGQRNTSNSVKVQEFWYNTNEFLLKRQSIVQ